MLLCDAQDPDSSRVQLKAGFSSKVQTWCKRNARNEFTQFTNFQNYARNAMIGLASRSRQRRRRMPLARCQAVADTREIIEIKNDLHRKLRNK